MSNQVFSNSFNGGTQYRPLTANVDTMTLFPNEPAAGGAPAYGRVTKVIDGIGKAAFWDQLNGVKLLTFGGIVNYSTAQNPKTVPYWSFGADATFLDGGTLLYSKVDNVIAVNASIPMNIFAGSTQTPTTLAVAIRIWNADGSIDRTIGYNGFQSGLYTGGLGTGAAIPFGICSVVHVAAGQYMGIVLLASTVNWGASSVNVHYGDFVAPQTTVPGFTEQIQIPAVCEYIKL